MANFNPRQHRDSRGRFARKARLFERFFNSFRQSTAKRTAPASDTPTAEKHAAKGRDRAAQIAAIKDEIKHLADWIEPEETGKFPGRIAEHIRRQLAKYEALTGNAPDTPPAEYWQAVLDSPAVIITGKPADIAAFLELLGRAGL